MVLGLDLIIVNLLRDTEGPTDLTVVWERRMPLNGAAGDVPVVGSLAVLNTNFRFPSPLNIKVVLANQQTTIILLKPKTRATTNILMRGGFKTEKPQISFQKIPGNFVRIRFCIFSLQPACTTGGSHNKVILIYSV